MEGKPLKTVDYLRKSEMVKFVILNCKKVSKKISMQMDFVSSIVLNIIRY